MTTTRVSLRDIHEAAFRSLVAHGASHGEAKAAAQMVLQAELNGGGGLGSLIDDLGAPPWSSVPVEIRDLGGKGDSDRQHLLLGTPMDNRVLRVLPMAVELVAAGDASVVVMPTAVTEPAPHAAGLVDAMALDLARVCGVGIVVMSCPTGRPHSATADIGVDEGCSAPPVTVRRARPEGSLGVGTLEAAPERWHQMMTGVGVLVMQEVEFRHDIEWNWISAEARAHVRACAAAGGVMVDADQWTSVHEASRRYLVPEQ